MSFRRSLVVQQLLVDTLCSYIVKQKSIEFWFLTFFHIFVQIFTDILIFICQFSYWDIHENRSCRYLNKNECKKVIIFFYLVTCWLFIDPQSSQMSHLKATNSLLYRFSLCTSFLTLPWSPGALNTCGILLVLLFVLYLHLLVLLHDKYLFLECSTTPADQRRVKKSNKIVVCLFSEEFIFFSTLLLLQIRF